MNDNFDNATSIGTVQAANVNGTVDEATIEINEPSLRYDDIALMEYGSTVWWKWTCPAGLKRYVNVSTAGSMEQFGSMQVLLFIFQGGDLSTLNELTNNTDEYGYPMEDLTFIATPGTTYYLRADPYNTGDTATNVHLGLTSGPLPINDDFASAINLGSGTTASGTGSLDHATVEADEPLLRYDEWSFEYIGSTVWWKWTCPFGSDRLVKVTTAGSKEDVYGSVQVPMDTELAVFTGSDLLGLTPVAEGDDTVLDHTSEVSFVVSAGTTYYIRVDADQWNPSNTSVKVNLTSDGAPITAAAHVAWGKARMTYTGGWNPSVPEPMIPVLTTTALNQAAAHFTSAIALSKSDPEANMLLAIVNLVKLQKEAAFQTLLTQLGVVDTSPDPELPNYTIVEDVNGKELFAAGANSSQGIEYLKTVARPRLLATVAMLEKITSTTFLATLPDHMRLTDSLYVDYGDVVMLRGGCKVLLAFIDIFESYNLISPLQDLSDMSSVGTLDAQHLADALGGLLKFSGSDKRASIKTNLQSAIALYNQGSLHIRTKRPQLRDSSHLFPLRENPTNEADVRVNLDKINRCIGGTTIVENGWSFNAGKLLTGTLSLRDLSPNFKGDKIIKGSVLKPDLGGALVGATVNKVEIYLRSENELYEGDIYLGVQVASGQEMFGSVDDPGGLFPAGSFHVINPVPVPAPGYLFEGWVFQDQIVSTLPAYRVPVIREYTLLAHFAEDNHDDDKDGLSNHDEIRLGTSLTDADSDDDGWPDGLDSLPLLPVPSTFSVSQDFSGISMNLPVGKILSITGLPAGVTYDAVNERLMGRPNFLGAGITIPKSFTITATVKPVTGANFTLQIKFTVEPLSEKLFGTFNGLADRGTTLNADLGGSFGVTITNSGGVSGKLVMNGFTYTIPANVRLDSTPGSPQMATCTVPAIKPTTVSPKVYIRFAIDALTGSLTGTASLLETPGAVGEIHLVAERLAIPALGLVGTYNSVLTPNNHPGDLAYPQGEGYNTLKVANTGAVTWTGVLADGTTLTFATTLSSAGDVPLHVMLYTNRGSIQGWSKVAAGRHTATDPFSWSKKNILTATRSYKDGFPSNIDVDLDGSLYVTTPVPTLFNLLTLTAGANNTDIRFSDGKLDSPFMQPFEIVAPSTVKPIPVSTMLNPNKVVVTSITASTGLFVGSFTTGTVAVPLARRADFKGIIVPHLHRGGGFFLFPESALATSPIYSGKVLIEAD